MNAQLASNQSSSLLSTISSSQNVMSNPYVYNQSANVNVFTSTQTVKVQSSSGAPTANSTINFDLPKMGLLGKTILAVPFYSLAVGATNSLKLVPNWALNAINSVELSSQGRVISRLDRSAIMARIGERPRQIKEPFSYAMALNSASQEVKDVFPVGGVGDIKWVWLNLDFAYNGDTQYALDTLFLQNCRVSVSFGDLASLMVASTSINTLQYQAPYLYCEYKNQAQTDSDALVSANYSSGLLSTILPTMVSEAIQYTDLKAFITGAGATQPVNTLTCQMKETSCVEGIFVMAMIDPQDADATASPETIGVPLHIDGDITFSSNGQNWTQVPADMLGYFSHQENESGRNAFGSSTRVKPDSDAVAGALQYVYYVPFANGGLMSSRVSNLLSLRELSNPSISCDITTTSAIGGKRCGLRIVYPTRQLATTVSSSGAYTIALSN